MPFGWEPRARDFPRRNRLISRVSLRSRGHRGGEEVRLPHRRADGAGAEPRGVRGAGLPARSRAEGANGLLEQGAVLVTEVEDIVGVLRPIIGHPPRRRWRSRSRLLPTTSRRRGARPHHRADGRAPSRSTTSFACRDARRRPCRPPCSSWSWPAASTASAAGLRRVGAADHPGTRPRGRGHAALPPRPCGCLRARNWSLIARPCRSHAILQFDRQGPVTHFPCDEARRQVPENCPNITNNSGIT